MLDGDALGPNISERSGGIGFAQTHDLGNDPLHTHMQRNGAALGRPFAGPRLGRERLSDPIVYGIVRDHDGEALGLQLLRRRHLRGADDLGNALAAPELRPIGCEGRRREQHHGEKDCGCDGTRGGSAAHVLLTRHRPSSPGINFHPAPVCARLALVRSSAPPDSRLTLQAPPPACSHYKARRRQVERTPRHGDGQGRLAGEAVRWPVRPMGGVTPGRRARRGRRQPAGWRARVRPHARRPGGRPHPRPRARYRPRGADRQ